MFSAPSQEQLDKKLYKIIINCTDAPALKKIKELFKKAMPSPQALINAAAGSLDERSPETALFLISQGLDIQKPVIASPWRDLNQKSLLKIAMDNNYESIALQLWDMGAPMPADDDAQLSIFMRAIDWGMEKIFHRMCKHNPRLIHLMKPDGNTPLHFACREGNFVMIRALVELGASHKVRNNKGDRPVDVVRKDNKGIIDFLNNLDVEPKNKNMTSGWHRTGGEEISRVSENKPLRWRITEVFNFESGQYTHMIYNELKNTQSHFVQSFKEVAEKQMLQTAHAELIKAGGKADASVIFGLPILKPKARL